MKKLLLATIICITLNSSAKVILSPEESLRPECAQSLRDLISEISDYRDVNGSNPNKFRMWSMAKRVQRDNNAGHCEDELKEYIGAGWDSVWDEKTSTPGLADFLLNHIPSITPEVEIAKEDSCEEMPAFASDEVLFKRTIKCSPVEPYKFSFQNIFNCDEFDPASPIFQ